MTQPSITERQQQWRDHVLAAAAFDGTIVEYAQANNLKTSVGLVPRPAAVCYC